MRSGCTTSPRTMRAKRRSMWSRTQKLSGRMTRSTDECEMSRSCHSATLSRAASALARSRRARPVICSQPIGLRLWGMADDPFCPLANGSSTSPISVFCRPRTSSANFSSEAPVMASAAASSACRSRWMICDVTRGAIERQARADLPLDGGLEVRVGAHRARDLADADDVARAQQPLPIALQLLVPERQLQTEGDRLGVHAVGASDHRRTAMLGGAVADGVREVVDVLQQQVAGLVELERQGRVDDVRRGQAEVQPARRRPNALGHRGGERDDVVPRRLLDGLDPRGVHGPLLADVARRLSRDQAVLGHHLGRHRLDAQPGLVAPLIGPDAPHLGGRVARKHHPRWGYAPSPRRR